ncbi:MAG: alpha/beta hydrolase [Betaproteobacteria bacterium]|nr:alpha/beta hydrolase [Betaproteobacteria bacterium]MDH5342082.1 alpha/beta hydrolase [Betaproteobacteria bacterium]
MDTPIYGSSFVTSDGVRLHVLEACPPEVSMQDAPSPVIAFIPGWSMPADVWREQLRMLGTTHCVAALDPRGQGESEVAASGYSIERRATDIREFVARYPRVVLVGWSLGALEALQYVHRDGHAAVDALVLVDSSVGEDPEPDPAAGPGFRETIKQDRQAAVEDFVRGIFGATRTESELETMTTAALRMPLDASLSIFPQGTPRTHWRDIVWAFPKPLLYAVSAQFAAQARSLQQNRPATRIEIFDEAGHALFADEPARFNELLMRFVNGEPDRPPPQD